MKLLILNINFLKLVSHYYKTTNNWWNIIAIVLNIFIFRGKKIMQYVFFIYYSLDSFYRHILLKFCIFTYLDRSSQAMYSYQIRMASSESDICIHGCYAYSNFSRTRKINNFWLQQKWTTWTRKYKKFLFTCCCKIHGRQNSYGIKNIIIFKLLFPS